MHKTDAPGHLNNEFTEGNPQTGTKATQVGAKFLNTIQREIVHVVTQAGISLDDEDDTQLYQAILVHIAANSGGGGGGGGLEYLPIAGGTMLGYITLHANPSAAMHAATKQYVDNAIAAISLPNLSNYVAKAGDTMTGFLTLHDNPTAAKHAVTKQYVDNLVAGVSSPFTVKGVSAELSVNFDSTNTVQAAHGAPSGTIPQLVEAVLVCKTADGGWDVGDELSASYLSTNNAGSIDDVPLECAAILFKNATHVGVRLAARVMAPAPGGLRLPYKNQQGTFIPVNSRWRIKFRWAY